MRVTRSWWTLIATVGLVLGLFPTGGAAAARPTAARAPSEATVGVPGTSTTATQAYVAQVYRDLFHRPPDPAGLETWVGKLDGGTPYGAVANAITSSDEYRSRLIRSSYTTYLGRAGEPAGVASWLKRMRAGEHVEAIQAGFIASDEFYARSGGTARGWVARLYQTVLGRSPAGSEVDRWVARIDGGLNRGSVARGFLYSTEHLAAVIDGYYVDLLGRHIDPTGRTTWVDLIQRGHRDEEIIAGIVASTEYRGKVTADPPVDTTPPAPAPVTAVVATGVTATSVSLSWTNPPTADFTGVVIRRAVGTTPPASPTAGTAVASTTGTVHEVVDSGLAEGTTYAYALFAHDAVPNFATPATSTATTTVTAASGGLAGSVTESGGGVLQGVVVTATSAVTGGEGRATTAADGTYEVPDLPVADDYVVCFDGSAAQGGSADQTGYVARCYDDALAENLAAEVAVAEGATSTGIDAALPPGAAVSGSVTDADGNGLADVDVVVGGRVRTTTDDDGTYLAAGVPAGSTVACFSGATATGGSSDGYGYQDECYDDTSLLGPTPFWVSSGATTAGIDAALTALGAISGIVTDTEGNPLADVSVDVSSCTADVAHAVTDDDGVFVATALESGSSCRVLFDGDGATGGWSDALGYVSGTYDGPDRPVMPGATLSGLDGTLASNGAVSGAVTDTDGHPLAGVLVTDGAHRAVTGADGAYLVRAEPTTGSTVCFDAVSATGGPHDTWGYVDQCDGGTLVVSSGAVTSGVDVSLVSAGTVAGTVTDDRGNPLAGVYVTAQSFATGTTSGAYTGTDGRYLLGRVTPTSDYRVCFDPAHLGTRASGGWSDDVGYARECHDDTPFDGPWTSATVSARATTTIGASLAPTAAP